MEFDDDHEDPEEEIGAPAEESSGGGGGADPEQPWVRKSGGGGYKYRECMKNHAIGVGGHAVDGCGEFMAAGEEGTLEALKCAACSCHRSFHRKEAEGQLIQLPPPAPRHHYQYYRPTGYIHVAGPAGHPRPLALPSPVSREEEDVSNPSTSGGYGGGSGGGRKRFRTKFTQEQKEKMLEFSERVEWRLQKQDEEAVKRFCAETGVRRQVLKVWMHNNKHTLGKKQQQQQQP